MKVYIVCFLALALLIHYSSSVDAQPKPSGSAPEPAAKPKGGASAPKSPSSPKADALKLPDGYEISAKTEHEVMAVKLHKEKVTWNDARKACFHEGHGAFLAYATTKEEEELFYKLMEKQKVNDLWVGLHDLYGGDGDYSTVGGEIAKEVAYYTWYPGEPNSHNGAEPCAEYRKANGKKGLNDRRCSFKFPYLCKIKRKLGQ